MDKKAEYTYTDAYPQEDVIPALRRPASMSSILDKPAGYTFDTAAIADILSAAGKSKWLSKVPLLSKLLNNKIVSGAGALGETVFPFILAAQAGLRAGEIMRVDPYTGIIDPSAHLKNRRHWYNRFLTDNRMGNTKFWRNPGTLSNIMAGFNDPIGYLNAAGSMAGDVMAEGNKALADRAYAVRKARWQRYRDLLRRYSINNPNNPYAKKLRRELNAKY